MTYKMRPILWLLICLVSIPFRHANSESPNKDKTLSSEALYPFLESSLELLCNSTDALTECFSAPQSDCSSSMRKLLENCTKVTVSKMPARVSEDQLLVENRKILFCALEGLEKGKGDAEKEKCKQNVGQLKANILAIPKDDVKTEVKIPTTMAINGIAKSLRALRCHPEVISACFRVSSTDCLKLYDSSVPECQSKLLQKFGDSVSKSQSGSLGTEMDRCVNKLFLPQVVQANDPTPECLEALKKY